MNDSLTTADNKFTLKMTTESQVVKVGVFQEDHLHFLESSILVSPTSESVYLSIEKIVQVAPGVGRMYLI